MRMLVISLLVGCSTDRSAPDVVEPPPVSTAASKDISSGNTLGVSHDVSVAPEASSPPVPPQIFTTSVAALQTEGLVLHGAVVPPDGARTWSAECLWEAKDPDVPSSVQTCTVNDVDVWTAHMGPPEASRPVLTLQVLHLDDPFRAGDAAHEVELHVGRLQSTRLATGARLIKEPATTWNHAADVVLVHARALSTYSQVEDTLAALQALAPDPSTF